METSSEDYSTSSYSSQVSEKESSESYSSSDLEFYKLPKLPGGKITLTCCHCRTRSRSQENSDESNTDSCSLISSSSTSLCITAQLRQPKHVSHIFDYVGKDTSTSSSSVLSEFRFESNGHSDTDSVHTEGLFCISTCSRCSSSTSSTAKAASLETLPLCVQCFSGTNTLPSEYNQKTANTCLPALTSMINFNSKVKQGTSVQSRDKYGQICPSLSNVFNSWGYNDTITIKRDVIHKLDELIRKKNLHKLLGFVPESVELFNKFKTEGKVKNLPGGKAQRKVQIKIYNMPNAIPLLDQSQVKTLEMNVAKRFLEKQLATENENKHLQPSWKMPTKSKRKARKTVMKIKQVYTPYLSKNQINDLEINIKQCAKRRHCNFSKTPQPAHRLHSQKWHAQCINKTQATKPRLKYDQIGNYKTIITQHKTAMLNSSKQSCTYSSLPLPPPGKHLLKKICLRKQEHVSLLWPNNFQKVEITLSYCFHPHGRRFQSMKEAKNPNMKESVFHAQVTSRQQIQQTLEFLPKDVYEMDTLPTCIERSDKEIYLAKPSLGLPNSKILGLPKAGQNVLHQGNFDIRHKLLKVFWAQPNVCVYSLKKHIPLPYLPSVIRGKTAQVHEAEITMPLLSVNSTDRLEGDIKQKKLCQHWEFAKLATKSTQTFLPTRPHITSLRNGTHSNKYIVNIFSQAPFLSEENEHYLELLVKKYSSQKKHDMTSKSTANFGNFLPHGLSQQEPQSDPQRAMSWGLGTKKDLHHFSSGDQKELTVEDKGVIPYSHMSVRGADWGSKLYCSSKNNTQFVRAYKKETALEKAWGRQQKVSHSCKMPMLLSKFGATRSSRNQVGSVKVFSTTSLPGRGWDMAKGMSKVHSGQPGTTCTDRKLSSQKNIRLGRHFVIKSLEIKAEVLPALVRRSHKAVTVAAKLNLPKPCYPGEGVRNVRTKFLPFIEQDALKCVGRNVKCKYLWSVWKQTKCTTKAWPVSPGSAFQSQANGSRLDIDVSETHSEQRQTQKIERKAEINEISEIHGGLPMNHHNSQTVSVSPLPTDSQVNSDTMRDIFVSARPLYFISKDRAQQAFNMAVRPLLDGSMLSQNDEAPTETDICAHSGNVDQNGTHSIERRLAALPEPTFAGGMLILIQYNRMEKHLIKKYLEVSREGIPYLVQWSHKAVFHKVKYILPKLCFPGEGAIIGRAEAILFMEQEALKRIDMNIQLKKQLVHGRALFAHDGSGENIMAKNLLHCPKTPFKPFNPQYCFPSLLQMEIHADLHNMPGCSMQRNNQWAVSPFGINILSTIQCVTSEKARIKKEKMARKEPLHPNTSLAIQDQPHSLRLEQEFRRCNALKHLPDINNKHQIKAAVDEHLKRRVQRLLAPPVLNNKLSPHCLNKLPSTPQYSNVAPAGQALVYNTLMATHATSPKGMLELPTMLKIHLNNNMLEDYFEVPLRVQKQRIQEKQAGSPNVGFQDQNLIQNDSRVKEGMEASASCHEVTSLQFHPDPHKPKPLPPINGRRVNKVLIKNVLEFSLKKIVLCHLLGLQWLGKPEMFSDCYSSYSTCSNKINCTRKWSNHITRQPFMCSRKESLKTSRVCSYPIEPTPGNYLPCPANGIIKANSAESVIKMGSTENMENYDPMISMTKSNICNHLRNITKPLNLHLMQKTIMNSCSTPWTVIDSRSIYESNQIQESRDLTRKRRMVMKHKQQKEELKSHNPQEAVKADKEMDIYSEELGSLIRDGCCHLDNVRQYHSLDIKPIHFNRMATKEGLDKRAFTHESQMINSSATQQFPPLMCMTLQSTSCREREQYPSLSLHTEKTMHCHPQSTGEQYTETRSISKIAKSISEGQLSRQPLKRTMLMDRNEEEESVKQIVQKTYELVSTSWHNITSLRQHKDGYKCNKGKPTITLNNTLQKTILPTSKRRPLNSSACTMHEKTFSSKRPQCCSQSHIQKALHCNVCQTLPSNEQHTMTSSNCRNSTSITDTQSSTGLLEIVQNSEINKMEEDTVKQLVHRRHELVSYSWHNTPSLRHSPQRHKDEHRSKKEKQSRTSKSNNTLQNTTKFSLVNESKAKSQQMQPSVCVSGNCTHSELKRQQCCDAILNFCTVQPSSKSSKNVFGIQKPFSITEPEELSHSHMTTASNHKKVLKPHRTNVIRRRCQKTRQAYASVKHEKVWKLVISHSYKKIQGWCENITFMQKS